MLTDMRPLDSQSVNQSISQSDKNGIIKYDIETRKFLA